MIESPLIQELMAEQKQQDIVEILEGRFGSAPPKSPWRFGRSKRMRS